jgi:mRNA interferase RelE/StbE
MSYSLNFSKRAFKELAKINEPFYTNIKISITSLTENPRPQGSRKLKGRDGYRIRVGDYRIIYDIFDSELVVNIIHLGHRKNIYGNS